MAGMENYSTLRNSSNRDQFDSQSRHRHIFIAIPTTTTVDIQANDLPNAIMDDNSGIEGFNDFCRINNHTLDWDFDSDTSPRKSYTENAHHTLHLDELLLRRYLLYGVKWVHILNEHILCHPFIVLRRQCQVHNASSWYHLQPITLLPSIFYIHVRQGFTPLWKGLSGSLLIRGMSMAFDDAVCRFTSWPKEIDSRTSLKRFGQHMLLKAISTVFVMSFQAACLVQIVQSDIASEKPGFLDVFREGALRLVYWRSSQKRRMLPAWALIGPTVSFSITKYLFCCVIRGVSERIMRRRIDSQKKSDNLFSYLDDMLRDHNVEIYSNAIALLTSEVAFYPFETVLYRIQLQGTRTIIDNLDTGKTVVPILTNYEGIIDCYRQIIKTEGFCGLYKGFGALILQFAAHIAIIKLTKWLVNHITEFVLNRSAAKMMEVIDVDRNRLDTSSIISQNGHILGNAKPFE